MEKDNVVNLGEKSGSAVHWSPIDTLKDAIKSYEDGEFKGKKLLILSLDEGTNDLPNFQIKYLNAGMRCSECIAIMRIAESIFLKEMKYL